MSFDQGEKPTIYCVNAAKTPLGVAKADGSQASFIELVASLARYAELIATYYGTPANVIPWLGSALPIPEDGWALVFLDDADQADAEGYHETTPDGFPQGRVFVRTTQAAGDKVSVTASHELAEMLVDPATNLIASSEDGSQMFAYEVCDAVEETDFPINGIAMSNFVLPSWFEGFRATLKTPQQFDYLNLCKEPFELLPGGYISVFKKGARGGYGWREIFGSTAKAERFTKEDRRGHRTTRR
jgi:hypothetical protein